MNYSNVFFRLVLSGDKWMKWISLTKFESSSVYVEIENSLKNSASESGVKKCLEDLRSNTLEDAKEYGSNHWEVTLKLALADSEWYAKYLEKLIMTKVL